MTTIIHESLICNIRNDAKMHSRKFKPNYYQDLIPNVKQADIYT